MEKENIIKCPKCGAEINVSEILYHQVQDKLQKGFDEQTANKEKEFFKKQQDLQKQQEQIDIDKANVQQQIDNGVKQKLSSEKSTLEKSIREKVDEEKSGQIMNLETELKQKSDEAKDYYKIKAE